MTLERYSRLIFTCVYRRTGDTAVTVRTQALKVLGTHYTIVILRILLDFKPLLVIEYTTLKGNSISIITSVVPALR